MPEPTQISFNYKEIAEALVKRANVHEGLWGIYMEFGISGTNIGPSPNSELLPAAIVPVVRIGIQTYTEASSLTVDAAQVNPAVK